MGVSNNAREYFWGDEARAKTAETCLVRQDAHFINCTGKPINGAFKVDQREICVISLAPKGEPENWRRFYVGHHVAKELLKLKGEELLPLFNPLKSAESEVEARNVGAGGRKSIKYSPLNREMHNAREVFRCLYNITPKPGGPIEAVDLHLQGQPETDMPPDKVRNFTIAISKFGTSLDKMVADLKAREPDARDFSFPLVKQVLQSQPLRKVSNRAFQKAPRR